MKHGYLIMAHNEKELLINLLKKLDDERNVIILHLDKKMKASADDFRNVLQKAEIQFVKRLNVRWGHHSQIQCEMNLLEKAVENNCDYYHLLTGVCLPVKSADYINEFFEKHNGKEFIRFDEISCKNKSFLHRIDRYRFQIQNRSNSLIKRVIFKCLNVFLKLAEIITRMLFGNRIAKYPNIEWMKGSAYFDITDACAKYVLSRKEEIKKTYRFTSCADEVFLQTTVYNSEFKDKISDIHTRYIEWSGSTSSPVILTLDHVKNFEKDNYLFARKFSLEKSPDAVFHVLNKE